MHALDNGRPPRRILVIRFSAMGDVLLTFPAVQALRERWPGVHLGYLTDRRWQPLVAGAHAVDEVIGLDRLGLKRGRPVAFGSLARVASRLAAGGWDLVVDLQCFSETALLGWLTRAPVRIGRHSKTRARWLYTHWVAAPHADVYMPANHVETLAQAGVLQEGVPVPRLELDTDADAVGEWRQRIGQLPTARRVALFVGSAKREKLWPPSSYVEAAARLSAEFPGLGFLVFGGPGEDVVVQEVVRGLAARGLGETCRDGGTGSLGALVAAFRDCTVTISNDTGPMHLSVAAGTPTVGLFRRRMAHFIPPHPHRHVVAPDNGEMTDITVDQVVKTASSLLRELS